MAPLEGPKCKGENNKTKQKINLSYTSVEEFQQPWLANSLRSRSVLDLETSSSLSNSPGSASTLPDCNVFNQYLCNQNFCHHSHHRGGDHSVLAPFPLPRPHPTASASRKQGIWILKDTLQGDETGVVSQETKPCTGDKTGDEGHAICSCSLLVFQKPGSLVQLCCLVAYEAQQFSASLLMAAGSEMWISLGQTIC